MNFPWYEILPENSNLQQGDIIPECPIIIPPHKLEEGDEPEVEVKLIDSIILSQSCDLVNNKVELVLVCPYYTLKTFLDYLPQEEQTNRGKIRAIDNIRKGYYPSYHLLNNSNEIAILSDYQVVDFRNVYGVQITLLIEILNRLAPRFRLLPPYREHLSQAFARYFMRVGLPQDIIVEGY